MYSDPNHILDEFDEGLEDCFEHAIMEDRPIEDCFGNYGEEICVWDGFGGGMHCCRRLVIKADDLFSRGCSARDLINDLREYIRRCPMVERITILGSEFSMRELRVVTTSSGKHSGFAAFIAGINVLKNPPVSVHCLSTRGAGPTRNVKRQRYI
tara:strand:- start:65 stop:526 length:462 start_codon:yes stop_codon:yes gene_type:complete